MLHCDGLLLLLDDDLSSDAPNPLVAAEAEFSHGNVDCALVMRHHHRDEVMIDVAAAPHVHPHHHFLHQDVGRHPERLFGPQP